MPITPLPRSKSAAAPPPPPAPASDAGDDSDFGLPPLPLASLDLPIPREILQHERSPDLSRARRYKIRCDNYQSLTRYILARSLEEARKCYLEVESIDRKIEEQKRAGVEKIEAPVLICKELPD